MQSGFTPPSSISRLRGSSQTTGCTSACAAARRKETTAFQTDTEPSLGRLHSNPCRFPQHSTRPRTRLARRKQPQLPGDKSPTPIHNSKMNLFFKDLCARGCGFPRHPPIGVIARWGFRTFANTCDERCAEHVVEAVVPGKPGLTFESQLHPVGFASRCTAPERSLTTSLCAVGYSPSTSLALWHALPKGGAGAVEGVYSDGREVPLHHGVAVRRALL